MNRIELYKEIKRIATEEMSELALIDLQKGQFNPNVDNSSNLPALLVEFRNSEYDTALKSAQNGTMTISMYIYQGLSDNLTVEQQESETTEILDRIDKMYQIFSGVKVQSFSPLTRRAEVIEQNFSDYLTLTTDTNGLLVLNPTVWGQQFHCCRVDFTTEVTDVLEDNLTMYKILNVDLDTSLS